MKLALLNLWINLKKSPIISLIIFIQLVLTGFFIFYAIYAQTDLDANNRFVQNQFGKYKFFYVSYRGSDIQEVTRSQGFTFTSIDETDYSDYYAFHDKISNSEITKTAVQTNFIQIALDYPISRWGIKDENSGEYSFYNSKSGTEYLLNTWSVDKNFCEYLGFQIESGRMFEDGDFDNFNPDHIPVILGSDYKGYLSLGDTFKGSIFAVPGERNGKYNEYMTFEVVGFIKKDQYVVPIGSSEPCPLNRYVVIPYFSRTLDYWVQFQQDNPQYGGRSRFVNYYMYEIGIGGLGSKHYITLPENEGAAYNEINAFLQEAGLEDYSAGKAYTSEQLADRYAERTLIQRYLLIIMLILTLLSVIFTSINKISANIKAYAVHSLVGATKPTVVFWSLFETFIYCALGIFGGYLWFEAVIISDEPSLRSLSSYGEAVFKSVIISGIFTLLACLFSFVFVLIKMKSYSLVSLVRGNDVKKGKGFSAYKIITLFMFGLVGICITFVTSYNYQVENIDKYQRNFYGKNAYIFTVQPLMEEDAPRPEVQYDIDVANYSIDRVITQRYDSIMSPAVRGTYFKGNSDLPEMTQGRYFTSDEVKSVQHKVVVGKNVVDDFVTEIDGKMIFNYRNTDYEVIGVMGREGHDTTLDNWAIFTLPTMLPSGTTGTYIIDAPSAEEVSDAIAAFRKQLESVCDYTEMPYSSAIDIGISSYVLYIFIALIILTSIVFSVYFIDKLTKIINVKKFIGYSKIMILADTAAQFILLSSVAFIAGNGIMLLLSQTALKNAVLFAAFAINLPILTLSFGSLILIAFALSLLAVYRSFAGTARDLKRG